MSNNKKEKVDVLLVRPPYFDVYGVPPLGLAYLAAVLRRDGFKVIILDCAIQKQPWEILKDIFDRYSPAVVGITTCTPMVNATLEVAKFVKQRSKAKVIIGGPHPTACPEEMLNHPSIDIVVMGEGEMTLSELTSALLGDRSIKQIRGLVFKENGKIIFTEPRPMVMDLDSLPFPAVDLLPLFEYSKPGMSSGGLIKYRPYTSILTSRGCPGRCIFCSKKISGYRWRARSPKNVVDEIELLVKNYGMKEIHIVDDCFSLDKKRSIAICDELIERKIKIAIKFANGLRADTVDKILLEKLHAAGCYFLAYGIESGSQEMLNRIHKGVTIEEIEQAVGLTKEVGIITSGYFIIGLPGETVESARQTIEFAKKLDLYLPAFFIVTPFPGTEMYKYFLNNGYILSFDYDRYEFFHKPVIQTETLTANDLMKLQSSAYREFYWRPKVILNHLYKLLPYIDYNRILKSIVLKRFFR